MAFTRHALASDFECEGKQRSDAGGILNSAPLGLSHLRTVRNYYAHRSEPLKRDALALGPTYLVGRAQKPSDILLFVEPTRSISVLERWILDVRRLVSALCA